MISFSNLGTGFAASGTISVTVTINKGDTVVVLITCNAATALTVSSVTDNGAGGGSSYSQQANVANGLSTQSFLWSTKAASAVTAGTLSVALSGLYAGCSVIVLTYTGVQDLGRASINTGNSATPSIAAVAGAASSWIVAGFGIDANVSPTAGTGNLRAVEDSGLLSTAAGVDITGGVTGDTPSVNIGTAAAFAAVALELIDSHVFDLAPGNQELPHRPKYTTQLVSQPGNQRNFALINHPENETWQPSYPQWLGNWGLRAAAFAIAMAAASGMAPIPIAVLSTPAAVTIDKFQPQYPDFARGIPRQVPYEPGSHLNFVVPEIPGNENWRPTYPDSISRIFPEATYVASGSSFLNLPTVSAEIITIDKWWIETAIPVPPKPTLNEHSVQGDVHGFTVVQSYQPRPYDVDYIPHPYPSASLNAGTTFVPLTSFGEVITADKWFSQYIYPTRLPSRCPDLGQFVVDANQLIQKEEVHPDAWARDQEYPQVFERKSPHASLVPGFSYSTTEIITVDKWHPQYVDAVPRNSARPSPDQYVSGNTLAASHIVTVDMWFQPASTPTLLPPRAAPYQFTIDTNSITQLETVSIDRFNPDYPSWIARTFPEAPAAASGAVLVIPVAFEPITIDKWGQPTNQPMRLPARSAELGQFEIDAKQLTQPEFPGVDKWGQPTSQPTLIPSHVQPSWYVVDAKQLTATELIFVDKWGQPTNQPTRLLPRDIALHQSVIDPKQLATPEAVAIDKFGPDYPSWNARIYPEATYVASGSYFVIPVSFEIILADKWVQPTNQPTRLLPRDPVLYQNVISPFALTLKEVITVDKFGQPPSQPTYVPARAASGQFIVDPTELLKIEAVSIDKFHPMYPDWIARVPNIGSWVSSGAVFQQPIVLPLNIISPYAFTQPVEIAQASVSLWSGPVRAIKPPGEEDL